MTSVIVNGQQHSGPPGISLIGFLRGPLGLTGTKPGCGEGECGACTVLIDGSPVLACQTQLDSLEGQSIVTIEGLGMDTLHPVQEALVEERAYQCGYCTPGMALRAAALLATTPDPTDGQIAHALSQSVCRCGGYPSLTRAVHRAVEIVHDGIKPVAAVFPKSPVSLSPKRPWDLSDPHRCEWFELLGNGLVVVSQPSNGWSTSSGAWIHVAPSGTVTAFSGKVDVGQDNSTAFRMLVAEELATDLDAVRVVLGDTDVCPFDMGTFGSRSMPDAGEALRSAAAGARQILLTIAAERWDVAAGELRVDRPGVVAGPEGTELGYGRLVEGLQHLVVLEGAPPLVPAVERRLVGRPGLGPVHVDIVTGARTFVSDLRLEGMRYGAVLRSPVPGSTLRSIDTRRLPDTVTLVRDGAFVGVIADNVIAARRGVERIAAVWDDPPPGPSDEAAFLRSNPAEGEGWQRASDEKVGDLDGAFASAATTIEATYSTAYIAHVPLETRAAAAEWTGGKLTVWVGTQVPFGVRERVADALGVDHANVRVIVPPTGSGFGGKHAGEVAIEAARLARSAGVPIKVHWSRSEEFTWGYVRPMAIIDVRSALDDAGNITAWDFLDINAGTAALGFPYRATTTRLRYQPSARILAQGSYRALGATANNFARESHIDELAHAAGMDPVEFRLHLIDDDRLATVLLTAVDRCPRGRSEKPPGVGFGVAVGLEKGGRVATCAEVRVGAHVEVTRLVTVYECGTIVNPDTVRNQVEGGTIMALGGALFERLALDHGRIADPVLAAYRVPRFGDIPDVEVVLIDRPDLPSAGAGETPLIAVAPAIANAIFDAAGRRLRSLPLIPDGTLPESTDAIHL